MATLIFLAALFGLSQAVIALLEYNEPKGREPTAAELLLQRAQAILLDERGEIAIQPGSADPCGPDPLPAAV